MPNLIVTSHNLICLAVFSGASSLRKRFNVTATDLDSGNNSLLSYSFLEDDAKRIGSYFRIYTDNKEVWFHERIILKLSTRVTKTKMTKTKYMYGDYLEIEH